MHTGRRTWNVPLGLGLFGAAVLVGGAILAYPEARHRPESNVDVSDPIATRPFPSFPGEVPAVAGQQVTKPEAMPIAPVPRPAPSAVGGGPSAIEHELEPERPVTTPETSRSGETSAAPAPLPAPRATPLSTTPAATAAAPTTTATPSTDASVGEPTTSTAVSDAAPSSNGDAALSTYGDAAYGAVGDATIDPNTPYVYPTFGAGQSALTSGQTPSVATNGAMGGSPSLFPSGGGVTTGGGGGGSSQSTADAGAVDAAPTGGGGGSPIVDSGVADVAPVTLTAPLLIPLAEGTRPESVWSSISGLLRPGDSVVAHAGSDPSAFLGWSDRAQLDAPFVSYAVVFNTPAALQAALAKLPATLGTVGLASYGDEKTFTAAAKSVHAAGRRMFVSVTLPSAALPTIGARAEVVELVVANGNIPATARAAAAALGAKAKIFVRLPKMTTAAALALSLEIASAVPGAGIAVPEAGELSEYR